MPPLPENQTQLPRPALKRPMRLGISGFAWLGSMSQADVPLLAKAKELGFAAFEVPMFCPEELPVAALRAGFEANDLECTVCAILPLGVNPVSPDPSIRQRAREHLAACIHQAAELGAHLVGGPLLAPIGYLPGHRPSREEWAWALEACQSVIPLLDSYQMTLSLEPVNRSETFLLRTAAEAKELCSQVAHPRIGVTMDTFHANIEERDIAGAITALGPLLKHMHMSENDRGPLGRGHVDFGAIMAALQAMQYDGLLVVEGFGFDAARPAAPGFLWADAAVTPEDLALSGIETLKKRMQ